MIEYRIKEIEPSLFVVDRRPGGFWKFLGWWTDRDYSLSPITCRLKFASIAEAEQHISKVKADAERKAIIRREYPLIRKYPA